MEAQKEGATCPRSHSKVMWGCWPSEIVLQFQKMLNHPLPRTEGVYLAGVPAPKDTPEATTRRPSRIPEGLSPHCLTGDQPVTVLPGCPGSQPEPLRCLV